MPHPSSEAKRSGEGLLFEASKAAEAKSAKKSFTDSGFSRRIISRKISPHSQSSGSLSP